MALPHLEREASDISTVIPAAIFQGGSPNLLRDELSLKTTRRFLFCGHADAALGAQKTLGFTSEVTGEMATIQPEVRAGCGAPPPPPYPSPPPPTPLPLHQVLAEMLGAHAPCNGGRLELVFLNGCCSELLGRAVRALNRPLAPRPTPSRAPDAPTSTCTPVQVHAAGVPVVVCWSTLAENSAARIFAMTFFKTSATCHPTAPPPAPSASPAAAPRQASAAYHPLLTRYMRGKDYFHAFDEARRGVLLTTRCCSAALSTKPWSFTRARPRARSPTP